MSSHTSDSDVDSSLTDSNPDYVPPRRVSGVSPEINNRIIRSKTRNTNRRFKSLETLISLTDLIDNNPVLKPKNIMANNKIAQFSLETAINLVPKFNGELAQEIYPFLNTCSFVMKSVSEECRPILLLAIISKLSGKAYAAIQHREITTWEATKGLLEITFCAKRTPGYLQLELSATKYKTGETIQEYSARVEKTLHELCNVSATYRSTSDAKAVHAYINEVTLTSYIEGLPSSIRSVIK